MNKLCPHDKLTTSYCEPCAEKEYPPPCYGPLPEGVSHYKPVSDAEEIAIDAAVFGTAGGLDASYYKTPFGDVQDMLEWLEEGGANWNVLNMFKSIWREFNPVAKKETTALYEAEKRCYYSNRDLRNTRLRAQRASRDRPLPDAEKGLEKATKE